VLIVALSLAACATQTQITDKQHAQALGGMGSSIVISRNVPAFGSSGYSPAYRANDSSFDTSWRSAGTPAWLAYDLSNVPASQRGRVLVVWYNETSNYDHTLIKYPAYNMPENYTIDVNKSPGGSQPPASGWITLVTVTGNHYHSRQHVIDMTGNNWVRMHVIVVDGAVENYDVNINMDVYDANSGTADDWIFFGDSITAGAMGHLTAAGVKSFAQLINARSPKNFPAQESGGIGFLTSDDGAKYINTWLSLFPGHYVGLSYGTNDALSCVSGANFYSNYVTMVQAVLKAGKIPVVPSIPWGRAGNIQQCAPALNAMIEALYKAFPQIIKGPDLWSFFQKNQNLISNDNIHPTIEGFGAYRQQWANTMLTEMHGKS
jgi:lysophospholipase L1-like esterase